MKTVAADAVAERLVALALGEPRTPLPADLELRIGQRLATDAALRRPFGSKARLVIAASMLLGIGVVFAFAVAARQAAGNVAAQDPTPKPRTPRPVVKVTDGDLPARVAVRWAGRSVHDVLLAIAKQAQLPYASCVTGLDQEVARSEDSATPRAALATGADAVGAHVEQHGAVLAIAMGREVVASPITMQFGPAPAHELFAAIAARSHANLVVAAAVAGDVEVDVAACHWRDLVEVVASALGAETFGCGDVLSIVPKDQVPPPRLHFAFERRDAGRVIDALAQVARLNVVLDAAVPGSDVTVACTNRRAGDVLGAVAATRGCQAERDGPFWRCGKREPQDAIVVTSRSPIELARALQVAAAPRSFVSEHVLADPVSVFCERASRRAVLAALAHAAGGRVVATADGFSFVK